jgi:hypothetical protein
VFILHRWPLEIPKYIGKDGGPIQVALIGGKRIQF